MTPAKKAAAKKAAAPRDLAKLPVKGECDPQDVFSHHLVELVPWHARFGVTGEFRELRCDRPGCSWATTEGRAVDPENPLPVPDEFDSMPKPGAAEAS